MDFKKLNDSLVKKEKEYKTFCNNKDKQSLFYFEQMTDIFYNELSYEVSDKKALNNLIYKVFKENINTIFINMQEYIKDFSKDSRKMANEIINISLYNNYFSFNNLQRLYNNFNANINKKFDLKEKIIVLISANINHFKGLLFSKFIFEDNNKISQIILKYEEIFKNEMIGNIYSKRDNLLSNYKEIIDGLLNEMREKKDEIKKKNLNLITNTSYLYLKEEEYINLNKYIDLNIELINKSFSELENSLSKMKITKLKDDNFNVLKDYLLSFNNTISVKIKNFFDEINLVITYDDNSKISENVKDINDMITHVFEMKFVFDKKFNEYKKTFNVPMMEINNFNKLVDSKNKEITEGIKVNIFNVFRSNIKIYNDVIYKTMLLKSRVDEYNTILSPDKVKDLLFK